jgi:DNA (cytosine-5)-methyltransferase 1
LNHIELFAGCGGLSLGLDKAGFELALANELSPMAAETFAYNFLSENLAELAIEKKSQTKVLWLSSKYKNTDLTSRLRENPFQYPPMGDAEIDIPLDPSELKGKLIVGSIVELNKFLEAQTAHRIALSNGFGAGGVDLVSGGPPCQSFSMAGLREKDSDKNTLPWEFAKFVKMVKPKIAVLENVTGILRPFIDNDVSYHAWFEVAKAFAEIGYVPLCLHINARLSGVPQNRPRFIMLSIRLDVYRNLECTFNDSELSLFRPGFDFLQKLDRDASTVEFGDLPYFDVKKPSHFALFEGSFLKGLINKNEVTVKDALDDLRFNGNAEQSEFVNQLNTVLGSQMADTQNSNHDRRKNSDLVQRRFCLYQILQKCERKVVNEVFAILKNQENDISSEVWEVLSSYRYMVEGQQTFRKFKRNERNDFITFLQHHQTKKRTQKALDAFAPAPATLSIPDDICHYDDNELRTLTVREMARIQSFPDSFIFRSKVTTGGKMRKFEAPQYTQVGNAVPPLLGLALGVSIINLLKRL